MADRNSNGTFAAGNPGGPGRPRRIVEREYLGAMFDAISIEEWREIIVRAIEDAKAGDAKARDWLTRYVLGTAPRTPAELAADEGDLAVEQEIELLRRERAATRAEKRRMSTLAELLGGLNTNGQVR